MIFPILISLDQLHCFSEQWLADIIRPRKKETMYVRPDTRVCQCLVLLMVDHIHVTVVSLPLTVHISSWIICQLGEWLSSHVSEESFIFGHHYVSRMYNKDMKSQKKGEVIWPELMYPDTCLIESYAEISSN